MINALNYGTCHMDEKVVEEVDTAVTYLEIVSTINCGADFEEVISRIKKMNAAFAQLYTVWRSREVKTRTNREYSSVA